MTEIQLSAASEERDTLQSDLSSSALAKDELIKKAWDTRDAAVKRKNNTQIELARSRIDVMQVFILLVLHNCYQTNRYQRKHSDESF